MSASSENLPNIKQMKLRYAGTCRLCGCELAAKVEAIYECDTKTVRCISCPASQVLTPAQAAPEVAPPLESGTAGASARREYERRKANDETKLREKWGKLGGIAVVLSDEKQSTRAWAVGAAGEEQLGARLDGLRSESITVLHDRKIPRSRANIDHIVIAPSGI